MLMIDNAMVKRVLTMRDCIAVQERAFASIPTGGAVSRPRLDTFVPCDREDGYYRFGSLEGASDGVYAVRLKSDIMAWPKLLDGTESETKYCMQPGTYCGLVILFSSGNGEPLCIINDGHLQHMRVGAAAGIGANLLARSDADTVGLIGSGGMARTALEAISCVRTLRKVKVYSRNVRNRAAFAEEMARELNLEVTPVDTAREAVRNVDILTTCTDSMNPVIEASWLEPGMHIADIGPMDLPADANDRIDLIVRQGQETWPMPESETFRKGIGHSRDAFVGGSPEQQKRLPRVSKRHGAPQSGVFYVDIVAGKQKGRTSAEQITQYRPVGNWGVQFSSVGALVYREAKKAGLGHTIPTEWFLQDIKN